MRQPGGQQLSELTRNSVHRLRPIYCKKQPFEHRRQRVLIRKGHFHRHQLHRRSRRWWRRTLVGIVDFSGEVGRCRTELTRNPVKVFRPVAAAGGQLEDCRLSHADPPRQLSLAKLGGAHALFKSLGVDHRAFLIVAGIAGAKLSGTWMAIPAGIGANRTIMTTAANISPQDALRAAVEAVGSQAAMARLVGVRQPSVWRWLHKGQALPPEHVLAVEAATGVSKHDLRPDIYPRTGETAPPAPATVDQFEHAR